ncbi:MAG: hypothetical protein ACXWC7_15115 [Chitinophagaceae bacterium]
MNIDRLMKSATILFLFIIAGCRANREIHGVYNFPNNHATITLQKDSSFIYRYQFEFDSWRSEGKWTSPEKNLVILNSTIKNRTIPLHISELDLQGTNNPDNVLSVDVGMPENEKKFYNCSLYLNDSLYGRKRCDSLKFIIQKPINFIRLSLTGDVVIPNRYLDTLFTETYFTQRNTGNKLAIKLGYNDTLFKYRVLENVKLRIARKGLWFVDVWNTNQVLFLARK